MGLRPLIKSSIYRELDSQLGFTIFLAMTEQQNERSVGFHYANVSANANEEV